jgi:replicative DNA helicase
MTSEIIEEPPFLMDGQDARIFKTILEDPNAAIEFANTFDENIFISSTARKLATAILSYVKNYKTSPTVKILLDKVKDFEEIYHEFSFALNEIQKAEVNVKEFRYELDKLKSKSIVAHTVNFQNQISSQNIATQEDAVNFLNKNKEIISSIDKIANPTKSANLQISLKDFLPQFKNHYDNKFRDPNYDRGIMTGYRFIDHIINGFKGGDLCIVGAATAGGKSLFLCNLAYQIYLGKNKITNSNHNEFEGTDVLYISLEMPVKSLVERIFARAADIPNYGIRDATLTKKELRALKMVTEFIDDYGNQLTIVDMPRGCSVAEIERIYDNMRRKPKVVVVDYLSLLDLSDKSSEENDWLKLGKISGELHEFARSRDDVVVLTAAQLNRPPQNKTNDTDHINIHRFGRSSLILHHATHGILIESREDEHTFSDMQLHFVKNRNGALGSFTLNKNLSHSSITDPEMVFLPDTSSKIYLPHEMADISGLLSEFGWNQ